MAGFRLVIPVTTASGKRVADGGEGSGEGVDGGGADGEAAADAPPPGDDRGVGLAVTQAPRSAAERMRAVPRGASRDFTPVW
jgi:hypothetical protein